MTAGIRRDERGSVTVEFAVALPIVAVAVGVAMGAMAVGATHLRLQAGAAAIARSLGREDAAAAAAATAALPQSVRTAIVRSGGMVCVTASRPVTIGSLPAIDVVATGCALDGGR